MTAITQRLLHLRPTRRPHTFSVHRFSTSSDSGSPTDIPQPESESKPHPQPSVSSFLNDVKSSLQKEPPPQNRLQPPRRPLFTAPPQTPPPSGAPNLDEIRRNLSGFRSRYASSPPSSASVPSVSLQELYLRNQNNNSSAAAAVKPSGIHSLDAIRKSISQLRNDSTSGQNPSDSRGKLSDPLSLTKLQETLSQKQSNNVYTEGDNRRPSGLEKGKNTGRAGNEGTNGEMRTALMYKYNYSELGTKLKQLRPENKKGKWFSLHELNERLAKIREMDEQQQGDSIYGDLRGAIFNFYRSGEEKEKNKFSQNYNIASQLSELGRTPTFMLSPPKDHLVEKYFHPDNLSAADKLKLELKKVRDEFKMSESDCGSARVQVAQLTTKIKYLSTVLQKKDKHSRRGLQLMVQRRKKLLKYLRRTDWDSYSLVLSKLGLRDNPDIKA